MARPEKYGLEYFPLDVDIFNDDKLQFVRSRFDEKGELVTIKLLTKIYRDGYFLEWNEDVALLFANSAGKNITPGLVNEIVKELLKRSFFNEALYQRFSILTSKGIQQRWVKVVTNAKRKVKLRDDFNLLIESQKPAEGVVLQLTPEIKELTREETPENSGQSTQSKVKESKVKEVKESKGNDLPPPDDIKILLLEFLEKNRKKYYANELMLAQAEIAKFNQKHHITDEKLLADPELKRKYDAEDERIYNKFLKYPMILEIEKCYNHYRKFDFKIRDTPITNWLNVIPSWMDKRNEFSQKGGRK